MPEDQLNNNFPNKEEPNVPDMEIENNGTVYAMPSKFRHGKFRAQPTASVTESKPQEKIKLKFININVKFLVIILGIIIVVVAAIFGFIYWSKNYLNKNKAIIPINSGASTETTPSSDPLLLTYEIKDEATGQVVSRAKIDFSAGALTENNSYQLVKATSLSKDFADYSVVGGVYQILPNAPIINKNITISIAYNKNLIDSRWEKFITLGYYKNSIWTTIPEGKFDALTTTINVSVPVIPSDIFALIVDKNKTNAANQGDVIIGQQVSSTIDSDQDNLTNTEEQLYQTGPSNLDTNGNGTLDGDEIAALKNPLSAGQDLANSGLVNLYTNPTWSYSLLYPSSWLIKPMPETDLSQVIIVTNTSEFLEASVEDNLDRFSPKDWYLKQSPDVEVDKVREVTIDGQSAVWDPSSLNLFISKDDKIYILTYNLGTETAANFKTTFKMMIKSFKFITAPISEITPPVNETTTPPVSEEIFPPPVRPDGVLIKYENKEDVYLVEGGKKRPIFSKQVFLQRNFKWEDVIIVPDSEIYQTGDMIY